MIKKTLLIAALLAMGLVANAQDTQKALTGRWRIHFSNGNYSDMMFFADGTGALLFPGGLLEAYINIKSSPGVKNGVIKFQYTYDIHRKKNPNYGTVAIKLVNDSTFFYSLNASLLAHPDSGNRKLFVYRKVKIDDPDTRLRLPNHHDLIGTWTFYHVKKNPGMSVVFIDKRHVWFKTGDTARQLNYRVDFSKQPIPIEFFADRDTTKILPAYLMFSTLLDGENVLRLELFPKNNRGDHFTMLGRNALFVKKE
ncbi:MAG: hypothetical protein M3N14_11130 [Bacteroidota bacterium]|nr:hypothetical protein [Bacteroidota bacterium]